METVLGDVPLGTEMVVVGVSGNRYHGLLDFINDDGLILRVPTDWDDEGDPTEHSYTTIGGMHIESVAFTR